MRDRAVGRGELPDAAWDRLECLLPKADGRGRPWHDHRQVINCLGPPLPPVSTCVPRHTRSSTTATSGPWTT